MTCGIYILRFIGTDKVYIGQSINIEARYKVHRQKLKNGSHNYKMLEAYRMYGAPYIELLCECTSSEELNIHEKEAFEIFDSINKGFNIAEDPDIHQEGDKNGASKYSNNKIVEVFELLLDVSLRYKDIERITGVNISTVRHISNGESHTWLAREYPDKYAILKSLKGTCRQNICNSAGSIGITYPKVLSPEGEIYEVSNANAFARKYSMDPSYFIKLLNYKAASCKGWKRAE